MDSNASVVQNQVQGNDEHHPDNVDPQQVVHSEEKEHQGNEVKSVFSKVKAKAKKIKDSIKKHGQNVLDYGHEDHNEDHNIPDDHHDLDKNEGQQVHEGLIHETEAVRSAEPTSEKVENLEKSEVKFEGTTVEREETNDKARVVDVSPTTEIEQNITTDQSKTFVGDDKSEQPNAYLERPIGLEEDPPKYNQTELTHLNETGTAEIDIAPVEKSFERLNVQDEQENVTETISPDAVGSVKDAPASSPSAGTGSLNQFVPDLYNATKIQEEEPHQEPQVVDVNPTTGINQNITTDEAKTFVYEENSEQPNVYFKEDSHGSGSRDEAHTPPEYHQTKDTDLTGAAGTKEIGSTEVEKFFVKHELKHGPEPNVTETQYPPAATESHNQLETEISTPTKTENPSDESHEYIPELSSAAKTQYHSDEIQPQFVQDFSTAAKSEDPSDASQDQFDTYRDHEISEATEQPFNNNNTTIKVEEQPSYESVEKPSNASNTDKTHKSDDASNKSDSTAEYGKNIDQSLTEKLGPDYGKVGEVESAVKSKVSETESEVEKPEKVSEESSVQSPGKGVVSKLKGVVGSWFGKTDENESTQGDEGVSKNEKSGVEVEQVNKAEG